MLHTSFSPYMATSHTPCCPPTMDSWSPRQAWPVEPMRIHVRTLLMRSCNPGPARCHAHGPDSGLWTPDSGLWTLTLDLTACNLVAIVMPACDMLNQGCVWFEEGGGEGAFGAART